MPPDVIVSDVDETALTEAYGPVPPKQLCIELARAKARDVAGRIDPAGDAIVVGCDSVLEMDAVAYGKPVDADDARRRWQAMAGRSGTLHTGHWLVQPSTGRELGEVASTEVFHAQMTDREIDAYIATGEPLRVAGAFTLDGLGGPFVSRIDGDPSNVVGLSLPLLRLLLADLGITWTDLWAPDPATTT